MYFYVSNDKLEQHKSLTMDSLCIPRGMIFTTTTEVENVFNDLFGGRVVERVDERIKEVANGQQFKVFYIHFVEHANPTPQANTFYDKLNDDSVVHVMTGKGKWFWKVYRNTSTKKTFKPTPRIMTDEDKKYFVQWKNEHNAEGEVDELEVEITENQEEKLLELEDKIHRLELEAAEEELMAIADEMAKE
jgi:hypothetical protein